MKSPKFLLSCLTMLLLCLTLTACEEKTQELPNEAPQQDAPAKQDEPAEAPVAEAPEVEPPGLTLEQKEEVKTVYIEEAQAEITPDNAEEQADALAKELEEELENL